MAYPLGLPLVRVPAPVPRELSAPFQTIGYAALIYGFWPSLSRLWMVSAIACVGRMALSNYLLQTLICTTLFYRFGLFMKFDRLTLLAFVIPVWAVNWRFLFSGYAISAGDRWSGYGVS